MDLFSRGIRRLARNLPCWRKVASGNRIFYVANKIPRELEIEGCIQQKFPSNKIISSKYTLWTFVPKNLFEQFHRVANLYFLIVIIVQLCIDSPVSPYTGIIPLTFVVGVAAIKQGYEDWLRHRADRDVNHRPAYVIRNGALEQTRAMDIQVGDVIRVPVNSSIPCDMVLLSSEDPSGQCHITTANLDGETNLKTFMSVLSTRELRTDDSFAPLRAVIECQQPNCDLYRFVGRIDVFSGDRPGTPSVQPLGAESVLLAGCSLKNTQYIYGCAIYTGQETKMFLNSKKKKVPTATLR